MVCSRYIRVEDQACDILLGHAGELVGEDVLQAHQPHQDPLVGLLVERVADHVELDDAPPLLKASGLVPRRVRRQQAGLETHVSAIIIIFIIIITLSCRLEMWCVRKRGLFVVLLLLAIVYLWYGTGVSDGCHDFVDEFHGDVTYDPGPLAVVVGERLRRFPLLTPYTHTHTLTIFLYPLHLYGKIKYCLGFIKTKDTSITWTRLQDRGSLPSRTDTATTRRVH